MRGPRARVVHKNENSLVLPPSAPTPFTCAANSDAHYSLWYALLLSLSLALFVRHIYTSPCPLTLNLCVYAPCAVACCVYVESWLKQRPPKNWTARAPASPFCTRFIYNTSIYFGVETLFSQQYVLNIYIMLPSRHVNSGNVCMILPLWYLQWFFYFTIYISPYNSI